MKGWIVAVATALAAMICASAEAPYDFRKKLSEIHLANLRDADARRAADEVAFSDGTVLVLPYGADSLIRYVAEDFKDFLRVSMGVRAQVTTNPERVGFAVTVRYDPAFEERRYRIETTRQGVRLVARDSHALAQAFYRLEDRMGLRGGPFLKLGTENRRPRFAVRMTHSGWAEDVFPDSHLQTMAHRGLTAILVYVAGVDKTKGREPQDVADLIRRAKRFGLDTYLYSFVDSFAHPRDAGGRKALERNFGEIATRYAEAKGVVFVGESAQFPTKDQRALPLRWQDRKKVAEARAKGDRRQLAGWFPCADYPEWLEAVKEIFRRQSPELDVVLWTYNWGSAEKADRLALIDSLPKDVSLMATFEMFERHRKRNGLVAGTADYSLSFAGPGKYFASEAEKAHNLGLTLYAQANAAGRTWDFGTAPYEPCPWQWNRRWQELVKAHDAWGLSGIMECHHYGWWPSFVTELENEAYVEGGTPFEEHVRLIAARDFGAANAERVLSVWRHWSDLAADYVASDDNQYGPFRVGPAYPYSIGGPRVTAEKFPVTRVGSNGIGICRLNYLEKPWSTDLVDSKGAVPRMKAELELFEPMVREYDRGADFFAGIASGLDARRAENARRMSVLARYLARTVETAVNLKRGALAYFAGDKVGVLDWARREYANAKATLPLVDADSRLGWEPSMEYVGGRAQIEWKLALMERTYGRRTLENNTLRLGRTVTWRDEFEDGSVNTNKWRFQCTMFGSDCVYANDSRTYTVTNGLLRLRVLPSGNPKKPFLLPLGLTTLDTMNYRYGYLEMRARVPFRHGAWPSFWLRSAARSRTVGWMAETDVFEAFSSTDTVHSAIHKWGKGLHASSNDVKHEGGSYCFEDVGGLNDDFHVYGFEWTPQAMRFYVDGAWYCTYYLDETHDFTDKKGSLVGMGGFHDPEGVIINNEIFSPGRDWCPKDYELRSDEAFPIEYDVDWVRLWQKPASEERITYDVSRGGHP